MSNRVPSTKELGERAQVHYDPRIPIRQYFRSADILFRQAVIYRDEGDLAKAYILFMKYTTLGVHELPKHEDYKKTEHKKQRTQLNKNCRHALDELEKLKPILDERYARAERARLEAVEKQKAAEELARMQQQQTQAKNVGMPTQISSWTYDGWSLADELKGLRTADADTESNYKSSSSTATHTSHTALYPELSDRNRSDGYTYSAEFPRQKPPPPQPPLVPAKPAFVEPDMKAPPPPIPNKTGPVISAFHHEEPRLPIPELPPKPNSYFVDGQSDDNGNPPPPPPPPKVEEDFACEATTEDGTLLRTMHVPMDILDKFLTIARPNTEKKLETCGILTGTLKRNVFIVTTLIIPKQTSTSDTCTTTNEEELFTYQDDNDLMTLGWIHTHPTQTCFMSSVDVHTHCSYQLMLPEAIAIVCAPKHDPDYGIFRLTDPPGLDTIANCREKGLFHPHPDVPIYTDASDQGHVLLEKLDFETIDMRNL